MGTVFDQARPMTETISIADFKRRSAKHVPEIDVQDAIVTWLGLNRVRAVRIESVGRPIFAGRDALRERRFIGLRPCSHVGTPDVLAFLPWGQACGIEVKRSGQGKTGLRESQARWIVETARLSPGTIILIPESLKDVQRALAPPLIAWARRLSDRRFMARHFGLAPPWAMETALSLERAKRRLAKGM